MAARRRKRRDWAVAPGEVLAEALDERGMSQSELARRMDRPIKTINEIVNAKAAVTPDTALQLELVLGVPASVWAGLEMSYRQQLAEQRAIEGFERHATWLKAFPLKDLARRGFVDRSLPVGRQVADLLAYFRVSSPDAWQRRWATATAVGDFRASPTFAGSAHARASWLRWGEILAEEAGLEPFDAARAREAAETIRELTRISPVQAAIDEAEAELAEAGVALVLVPEFEGTRLSGAARWLRPDAAIVQLSLRHKTDDHLWFTCLHEIGHLLDQPRRDFVDAADDDGEVPVDPAAEQRANEFARNTLIDPVAYRDLVAAGAFSREAIRRFAREQEVAPGIVVGRLQHDGHVAPGDLNDLKQRLRFSS